MSNPIRSKKNSPLEPPKYPKATKLQAIQPESQPKAPKLRSKAIELLIEKIESKGPESKTVGPKHDVEDHGEESGTSSKSKVLVLTRYVRRHHEPDQINGDKSNGTMTMNKLTATCFLSKLNLDQLKFLWIMKNKLKK